MVMNLLRKSKSIILFFFILIIACFYYFHDYKNHIFFIDEYEFMRKSYYFDLLFMKHDLKDRRWYNEKFDSGAAQPKVGPYIFGFVLHLSGIKNIETKLNDIGFNNIKVNGNYWWFSLWMHKPSTFPLDLHESLKIIWIGRITAIIFTIGTVCLIYIIGSLIYGNLFGFIVSLIIIFNRLLSIEGKFAMTDTMQLFFFLLNLLLCRFWLRALYSRNNNYYFMVNFLIGVNAAFAIGTKVSAIMLPIFLLSVISLILLTQNTFKQVKKIIFGILIIGITCVFIFYLLHPFIQKDPIYSFLYMFQNRLDGAKNYYRLIFPESAIYDRKTAVYLIIKHTLIPNGKYTNFHLGFIPIDYGLFLMGIVLTIKKAAKSIISKKTIHDNILLPLWTIVVFCCLIYYLMNDWSRYYLTLISCFTFVEAYALSIIIKTIRSFFVKNINFLK
jgi:hypothetical protein